MSKTKPETMTFTEILAKYPEKKNDKITSGPLKGITFGQMKDAEDEEEERNKDTWIGLEIFNKTSGFELTRKDPFGHEHVLDRDINFFILMLEQIGAKTVWSCAGHPNDFYIVFKCSYALARKIQACGFINIEICGTFYRNGKFYSDSFEKNAIKQNYNQWRMNLKFGSKFKNERDKICFLALIAARLEKQFGPLKLKKS